MARLSSRAAKGCKVTPALAAEGSYHEGVSSSALETTRATFNLNSGSQQV